MNDQLHNALNEISDAHLLESTQHRRRRTYWARAAAAILALVLLILPMLPNDSENNEPNLDVPGTSSSLYPTKPTTQPNHFEPTTTIPTLPTVPTAPTTPADPIDPIEPPAYEVIGGIDLSVLEGLPDLLAAPKLPTLIQYPNQADYGDDWKAYNQAVSQWRADQDTFYDQPEGYANSLTDFFQRSIREFLSSEENSAYSPVNVYLAMAMLAETTDGNSRQQILDLFGVDSIQALRTQASYLWNAHYNNDGQTTLLMANSLWLDNAFSFHQATVDRLANDYYASVFSSDLGSDASNAQLQAWLNAMTGGLLEEQSKNAELSKNAVFALASTIFFKAGWTNEFNENQTRDDTFHSPNGNIFTAFMHSSQTGTYYRGSNFSAVCMGLTGNNGMWIILPDDGVTVAEVMAGEEYLQMTLCPDSWTDKTHCILEISLPKFDVTSQNDLIDGMKKLGLSDIFDYNLSDFTPMTSDSDRLCVTKIDHAARIVIDEEGIIAAAYTVIDVPTASEPNGTIEFNANRPFLFIVSNQDNLPLFAGTITSP